MRLIMLGAGLTAVITLAGLLAMTGTLRALISPQLSAEVHFADFPLPKGLAILYIAYLPPFVGAWYHERST